MTDPDEQRRDSHDAWTRAAPGWERRQEALRRATAPVSRWLVEAIAPQPGHRVLELAAGVGETGFLAAELTAPGGRLICSDQTEAMLETARRRAGVLGLTEVEFRVINAESIDLPLASQDGVLCRWGFMLMVHPEAALQECRRVLVPGGRLALAAWTDPGANPWASAPVAELLARGLAEAPAPGAPGMFAWSESETVSRALEGAGFVDVEITTVDFSFEFSSVREWWETQIDLSGGLRSAVAGLSAERHDELRDAVAERLEEMVRGDGSVSLPARTLVAAAGA